MELEEIIDARIAAALEKYKPKLGDLPVTALSQRLNDIADQDGDTGLQAHSVGPDALGVMPAAEIENSGVQAFTAGITANVSLPTIRYDTAGMANATANALTAPFDGIYLAVAKIQLVAAASPADLLLYLRHIGVATTFIDFVLMREASNDLVGTAVGVAPVLRGERIDFLCRCSQNANSTVANLNTRLSMTFLSNYLQTT